MKGNTDLKGGAITSTDKAIEDGRNSLTTGTLTQSDIQNRADTNVQSIGISLSSDMVTQGKYGAAKAGASTALNNGSESDSSSGQTLSAVSGGAITITDDAAQQQRTGQTAAQTVTGLNRDTANAQTAVQRPDVQSLEETARAEKAIKQEAFQIITAFTDETRRNRFLEKPEPMKVVCPAGADCIADPSRIIAKPATPEEMAANTSLDTVLAVNGILNDRQRAAELAYQNAENVNKTPGNPDGNKPTTIYLLYVKPANNGLSELMGAAYEKVINSMSYGLANFLGYTNAATDYADALASRGQQATTSLGHSRGTLVQESAFTILGNRPDENGNTYTNSSLTVRGVGGATDAQSYSAKAAAVQGPSGDKDKITYNYFSNDPVSVSSLSGGNPGVWTLKDLWQVYDTTNSMHSCYGTGGKGCTQVEIPMPDGPQGTPAGNAMLIQYKGGKQVDDSPIIGRNSQSGVK